MALMIPITPNADIEGRGDGLLEGWRLGGLAFVELIKEIESLTTASPWR